MAIRNHINKQWLKKKKLLSIGKRVLSSLLCTVLLLGSIVAADVFYNFTGETAFASTKVYVDDGSDDYNDYSRHGKIDYLEYGSDNLSGKVFKYRNSVITVKPDYTRLCRHYYYSDEDDSGWTTGMIESDKYKYYLALTVGASTINNTVDYSKRVEPALAVSSIGTYGYAVDLYWRGDNYMYGYNGNSLISSGTFYVDQETGIKVISGNPSWVAAGGTVSAYYCIQNQC